MVPPCETPSARRPLVVVGAGMATYALLRRLVEVGGTQHYAITVIGEEPRPCYDRVHLTDFFSGKSPEDLLLAPPGWYQKHGITLLSGVRVTEIRRGQREVLTDEGHILPYQQLVLATGSRPFVPPIDGADLPGVFVYRTIEDIQQIRTYAQRCRSAAVLGGGLLGLEAGKALHDLNLETHVIEVAPELMPRQLNAESGALLKTEIERLGVHVHVLRRAERIEAVGERRILHLAGHESLEVDLVVISAGIRPRDELARQAELPVGTRGGIVVDSLLRTSDPQIHAIGECVSFNDMLFGLVGPCYEMAEIVANNLSGQILGEATSREFHGGMTSSRLKLMGVDVATMGIPIGEAEAASLYISTGERFARALLVEERRLVGAIGVGDWPERERINGVIAKAERVSPRQLRRFQETGGLWRKTAVTSVAEWPDSATVCSCLGITKGELTVAMQQGATDASSLATATSASTVCGSCRNLLCELAGQPAESGQPQGTRPLLVASCLALIVLLGLMSFQPLPLADTVQSSWRNIDFLWHASWARQVTGYVLLGISIIALLISIRKRLTWFRWGRFSLWRGLHGLLGAATLGGFLVHTGLRMGHNFTFVLALTFLLLNLLGACTGLVASLENRLASSWGQRLRAWRPQLTQLHIWLFWPLPALLLFHIISVYYY